MSADVQRPSRRPLLLALIVVAPALAFLALAYVLSLGSEQIVIEVPHGTAQRIADGERVELIPARLEVSVGDSLEIRNLDDTVHEVGPYTVDAGQTLHQTFTSPGTIQGLCTLHPSGAITIVVR